MAIPTSISIYCKEHGYTDPCVVNGYWWAFPLQAVMPVQLPEFPPAILIPIAEASEILSNAFAKLASSLSEVDLSIFEKLNIANDTNLDPAVAYLEGLGLSPAIAKIRIKEFCERHNINEAEILSLIANKKIQLRHGVLCPGKNFHQASRKKRALAIHSHN